MSLEVVFNVGLSVISILVTIVIYILMAIQKQISAVSDKMEGKMDVVDHDKQAEACASSLRTALTSTYQRLDDKIMSLDRKQEISDSKLCSHSHTEDGRFIPNFMPKRYD
jgi:uncharacterized protein YdbL (DUF1318 family)